MAPSQTHLDLNKYGIADVTDVVYNPSFEQLFEEDTNPALEGYDKGVVTELGACGCRLRFIRPFVRLWGMIT